MTSASGRNAHEVASMASPPPDGEGGAGPVASASPPAGGVGARPVAAAPPPAGGVGAGPVASAPPPAGGFGYGAPPGGLGPAFGPVILPSPHRPSSSYAIWTLSAGIFSIIGLMLCFVGMPFALGSIAMGVHHAKRCDKYPDLYTGKGLAIAGAVCGGVSLAISALAFAAFFCWGR